MISLSHSKQPLFMTDILTDNLDKQTARSYFLELRRNLSEVWRSNMDRMLLSNTLKAPAFKEAKVILCYYPVRGEPGILPIATYAIGLGKKVAFPISHPKERRLSFHVINSLSDLSSGAYNIPEPLEELPIVTDFSDSLCIVPALAFDRTGRRLGYGGGYYDRFLSTFNGTSAGLAYSQFFVDKIPTDAHDAAVDIIITENGGYYL